MDEYPEELLTPPLPLVALVGMPGLHPQVSAFLGSCQPSMVTLSIPHAGDVSILGGKERRPVDAKLPPPVGIIKAGWLSKHRQQAAGVVVVFLERDKVYGDPSQWLEVCSQIDHIKGVMRGRNMKMLLLLVQPTAGGEINEDRFLALRKRSEVEPRCCLTFIWNDPTDLKRSLNRVGNMLVELVAVFYREEGRRVKARVERKAYSHWELTVRYHLKMAVYAEFRRDWVSALKSYEMGYTALKEGFSAQLSSTPVEMQPVQTVVELKAVAEILHLKVATLLLHSGKEAEAVRWFRRHVAAFRYKVGPLEGAFLHWAWMARQYQVFAELLQQRLATGTPPAQTNAALPSGTVNERELQPAYYYQLAAAYMLKRRRSFESALAALEAFGDVEGEDPLAGPADTVAPSLYIGQAARLLSRGSSVHDQRPTEAEYIRHALLSQRGTAPSQPVLGLLAKAHELYKHAHAVRMTYQVAAEMGREYFHAREYENARRVFDSVAVIYRKEGWAALLAATLGYLRECARHLGLLTEYLEYSLELAAVPSPEGGRRIGGPEVGPAGPLGELQHEVVHKELVGLVHGTVSTLPAREGDSGMTVDAARAVDLTVGPQSPLRSVIAATAAFHERSVKRREGGTLTVALMSRLPQPIPLEELELHFSDPSCSCVLTSDLGADSSEDGASEGRASGSGYGEADRDGKGTRQNLPRRGGFDLTLNPGQWKRITLDVVAAVSGRIDCIQLVARLARHASLVCPIQPPPAVPLMPLWAHEPSSGALPLRDVRLSMAGQTWVEVEEEAALVEVVLECATLALVGEALPVRVGIRSTGHPIHGGKVRLRVGGLGEAPTPSGTQELGRPSTPPESSPGSAPGPAEILPLEGLVREASGSFQAPGLAAKQAGMLEVPFIKENGHWSALVYVKWRQASPAVLTASLSYSVSGDEAPEQGGQVAAARLQGGSQGHFQVTQTVTVPCEDPPAASFRYVGPYRKDALLPGVIGSGAAVGTSAAPGVAAALPVNDTCTLVVSVACTSSVPVELLAVVIEEANPATCRVVPAGAELGGSGGPQATSTWQALGVEEASGPRQSGGLVLWNGEAFTRLFLVTPSVASLSLPVGKLSLRWQRHKLHSNEGSSENPGFDETLPEASGVTSSGPTLQLPLPEPVNTLVELAPIFTEAPPMVVTIECPHYGILGTPFTFSITIHNRSTNLVSVTFSLIDSPSFLFSGAYSGTQSVLPLTSHPLSYCLVPITSGMLQLPRVRLTTGRFNAKLHPSPHSSKIFVYPSLPHMAPQRLPKLAPLVGVESKATDSREQSSRLEGPRIWHTLPIQ